MGQRTRSKTTSAKPRARLALDVGAGGAGAEADVPTEFRIFAFGVNHSEKGDFLFDATAAESVMAEYREHGKPMLLDFNHGTTLFDPTPEQGIAAGQFVPEIRSDGLWATQIKWTERARSMLAAREYRLFSPFFEHDPKTGRILRLINVALTNLPALDNIEPLVAASAMTTCPHCDGAGCAHCNQTGKVAASAQGGAAMDWEKLYNDLKVRHDSLETEIKALRAKLSAFEEKEPEKTAAVTLRASVLQLVGKQNDAEALGTVGALKEAHAELVKLRAETERRETERLTADYEGLLKQASEAGKVAPSPSTDTMAARGYWDDQVKKTGHATAIVGLRAFVAAAPAQTRDKPVQAPVTGSPMNAGQRSMAETLGWDQARIAAYEKSQTGAST